MHNTVETLCSNQWSPVQFAAGLDRALNDDRRRITREDKVEQLLFEVLARVIPAGNC